MPSFAISVENVSKKFKGKKGPVHVLKGVSLRVKKGEIFALLGPNGAGKTTLINIMLGLVEPDTGSAKLLGKPVRESLHRINFASTDTSEHWTQAAESIIGGYCLLYGLDRKQAKQRVASILKEFRLDDLKDRPWFALSTGERSRLRLAKATINRPKLILLDEPTSGLDVSSMVAVRRKMLAMNKSGITIFLTSHNMHEVEKLADRVAFIREGEILDVSSVKLIKKRYRSLENYFVKLVKRHGMV